jgi:hypothetical protein
MLTRRHAPMGNRRGWENIGGIHPIALACTDEFPGAPAAHDKLADSGDAS